MKETLPGKSGALASVAQLLHEDKLGETTNELVLLGKEIIMLDLRPKAYLSSEPLDGPSSVRMTAAGQDKITVQEG